MINKKEKQKSLNLKNDKKSSILAMFDVYGACTIYGIKYFFNLQISQLESQTKYLEENIYFMTEKVIKTWDIN